MPIRSFSLQNLGPFDKVSFEFDKQVNVLVGPNNCGKSCALIALADIIIYPLNVPRRFFRKAPASFRLAYRTRASRSKVFKGPLPILHGTTYWDEEKWAEVVRVLGNLGYTGFIPALRWSTDFRSPGPLAKKDKAPSRVSAETYAREILSTRRRQKALDEEGEQDPELRRRRGLAATDAYLISDETIIQRIIELDYKAYRQKKPSIRNLLDRIASVASEITEGFPIKFSGVGEDDEGLFPEFVTPDGRLPLNCLSQGTQSIIQWVAHLLLDYATYYDFPSRLEEKPAAIIIDEIDAHLHPSWQRRIIPTLISNFPKLQLFCSTHSPLMLAGLKAGQVHLLARDKAGKVTLSRNETDIVGWSADEILRNFLDLEDPTDSETAANVARLRQLRAKQRLSASEKNELGKLQKKVPTQLLGGPIAAEVARLKGMLTSELGASPVKRKSRAPAKPRKSRKRHTSAAASRSGRGRN